MVPGQTEALGRACHVLPVHCHTDRVSNNHIVSVAASYARMSPGMFSVCVEATTICGDMTAQECCTATCPLPAAPQMLQCMTDVCTCVTTLTWTNPEPYDTIEVLVGGVVVQTLPMGTTTTTQMIPTGVATDLSVRGVRNGVPGASATCTETCPGVPAEILDSRSTWSDKAAYDAKADELAQAFQANFDEYRDMVPEPVASAGPVTTLRVA